MPRLAPYVPPKDADLASWAANFSALLTANPATYGQTSGTAAAVAAAQSSFAAAYALVTSPATKTASTVSAKNFAKASMLAQLRPVAQNCSLNPAVATSDKAALGVNPRTSKPTPITAPATYPILAVQGGASGQLYVRYRDSAASVSVKSKPYGVAFVVLGYQTSATAITNPANLVNRVQITKSPYLLQFTGTDLGMQCYLAAYYLCANGKTAGWGPVVSFTVPLGS
jgi:hypothetical protein